MWDKPWKLCLLVCLFVFLCQECSKCCAGGMNLGVVDGTEAVIVDEIFWSQCVR